MPSDRDRLDWLKSIPSLDVFLPADRIGLQNLIDYYMNPPRRTVIARRDDPVSRAMNAARGVDPDQAPRVVTEE